MQVSVLIQLEPGEQFTRNPDRVAARVQQTLELADDDMVLVSIHRPVLTGQAPALRRRLVRRCQGRRTEGE